MKNINRLLIISLIIFLSSITNIYGETKDNKDIHNILLINSYDIDNKWENSINDGFKESMKNNPNINIKTEYLDIRNNNNEKYLRDFEKLLNTKYRDSNFDMVVTIDDEAFNLARKGLLNKNSIFYKKIIVTTGVSELISLTSEEKEYITGFMDGRSKIELIKLITRLQPQVKTINVLIDDTNYCKDIKDKLLGNRYLLDDHINLNFIEAKYENEILEKIEDMDENNEALLICGVFKDKNTYDYANSEEFISKIKKIKHIPIYTSREDYIGKGVIGGYIDMGSEYGKSLGKMVLKIYKEEGISSVPFINRVGANYMVDYNQIYKYDINPSDLPEETIIINKKPYDLLITKNERIQVYLIIIVLLITMLYIITMMFKHRKNNIKNKKLYNIAKEREQLKTDFIVNMSHELRTPLNIISSASTLLEMKVNKNEKVEKEYILDKVERINKNSNRLRRLINNLIDITKFDSGFYECRCKNENIVYVVEDIVFASVDYANEKDIEVLFDTDAEEIITSIDKEKIERVILNILSNAIKFTNENGKIEVRIKHDDKFVYISLKDNGIGIPKEKVDQIFHRFYQVDSILSRKNEGSGIGLCIVDEIIKMHNGKVEIDSEENKGTTFEIILNLSNDDRIDDDTDNKTDRNINDAVKIEMANI
ncbi:sensor histidine kinase [Terrisporobacter mayombei]|uniref:histidine kinase n=1 Tax=Terrisporobacter mayombei TaxID=1541 RepID=A0ABY9PZN3_9FIRM|nr:HAMP domain-containing sensor histidine kinase [Terrisporobacter mayombei]MCC3868635.1 HAMP domain-containing histidine kinase [Terrisporobacter mayombei]WMT80791.1 Sensor histidine kinase RcsC [Terrisporobacter mayombei]